MGNGQGDAGAEIIAGRGIHVAAGVINFAVDFRYRRRAQRNRGGIKNIGSRNIYCVSGLRENSSGRNE